jgi:hypothetical protein
VRHQLRHCAAFERPGCDATWVFVTVAQQPRFSDRAVTGQGHVEPRAETPTAPEAILKYRLKAQRIERYLIHGTESYQPLCRVVRVGNYSGQAHESL